MAWPATAWASCSWVEEVYTVHGQVHVQLTYTCDESSASSGGDSSEAPTQPVTDPPRDSNWDPICVRTAIGLDQPPERFCQEQEEATVEGDAAPTVTPGMVAVAFQELPLPASELVVQPPGGRTLVNFATNFYTEREPFERTVTLLGQQVELRIWPESFRWVFGDGTVRDSASAGAPYPALEITHEYRQRGRVAPRVDTTYAAEFRVNGGPWAPVAGTVTIAGDPVGLRVETATPVLVGYQ